MKSIEKAMEILREEENKLSKEQEFLREYIYHQYRQDDGPMWLIKNGYDIPPLTRTRTVDKDEVTIWSTPTTI